LYSSQHHDVYYANRYIDAKDWKRSFKMCALLAANNKTGYKGMDKYTAEVKADVEASLPPNILHTNEEVHHYSSSSVHFNIVMHSLPAKPGRRLRCAEKQASDGAKGPPLPPTHLY
jgi:hypothetical protein